MNEFTKEEIIKKAAKQGIEQGWLHKNTVVCGVKDGSKKIIAYDNMQDYLDAFSYHIKRVFPPNMTECIHASEIYNFIYGNEFGKRKESFNRVKSMLNKARGKQNERVSTETSKRSFN